LKQTVIGGNEMKRVIQASALALIMLVFLCASALAQNAGTAPEAQSADASVLKLTGSCRVIGTDQFPVLEFTSSDGKIYSLGGPYYNELLRLYKMTIRIEAKASGKKQALDHLVVFDYEILDTGKGEKPFVGSVEKDGKSLMLKLKDSPQVFTLSGNKKVLEKLSEGINGKVWIIGDVKGSKLKVRKFNVIKKGK